MSTALLRQRISAGRLGRHPPLNPTLLSVVVAAVAIAVRLPDVYRLPFWEDEVASARILAAPSFGAMLRRVGSTESTPPLWYIVGWVLHQVGVPLLDERLLSVTCGGLLAIATVALGRRLVPLPLAAAAGLAVALGGEFVFHGHELRAYEPFALLTAVFGLAVLWTLEASSWRRDLTLGATVAAGTSTHYFFMFSAAAVTAWLWLDPRARPVRRRATISIATGGAIAAIWTPVMLRQYAQDRFAWIGPFNSRIVLAVPLRLFTQAWANTELGLILSVTMVGVVAVGAHRLVRTVAGRLVVVLALAPIAEAAATWLAGSNVFDLRNLIGVGPFVAVTAMAALGRLPAGLPAATAAAFAGYLALGLVNAHGSPPFDRIARRLVQEGWTTRASIAVLQNPLAFRAPLEWYLPHRPDLDLFKPGLGCSRLYLVRASGRVTLVRRPNRALLAELRHATILAAPRDRPECAVVR